MEVFSELIALALWGMLLAAGYQLLLELLTKTALAPLRFLLYCCGVAFCFGSTSVFLYLMNGGNWGIYGFLAMAAGFFLYYRRLWGIGEKALRSGGRVGAKIVTVLRCIGNGIITLLTAPWGVIIAWGERRFTEWNEAKKAKAKGTASTAENTEIKKTADAMETMETMETIEAETAEES